MVQTAAALVEQSVVAACGGADGVAAAMLEKPSTRLSS
jgi:hypothetical protein